MAKKKIICVLNRKRYFTDKIYLSLTNMRYNFYIAIVKIPKHHHYTVGKWVKKIWLIKVAIRKFQGSYVHKSTEIQYINYTNICHFLVARVFCYLLRSAKMRDEYIKPNHHFRVPKHPIKSDLAKSCQFSRNLEMKSSNFSNINY